MLKTKINSPIKEWFFDENSKNITYVALEHNNYTYLTVTQYLDKVLVPRPINDLEAKLLMGADLYDILDYLY